MRTVSQIQSLCGSYVASAIPGMSPANFYQKLNQALEKLYAMGNWKDLLVEYRTSISSGYFCLPPDFESVLAGRINDFPISVNGMTYEYQPKGPGVVFPAASFAYGIIDKGFVPLMSEIPLLGLNSLDFELVTADATYSTGDTIIIEYTMTSGPGKTTLTPTSGTTVNFAPVDPIVSIESITYLSLPDRVIAKDTSDYVYAILLPGDGVSRFRRYQCPQVPSDTTDIWIADLLVKRAFIPCVAATDKVYLDSIDAIKYALIAVTCEDAGDEDRALLNWNKVNDILEKELSQSRGNAKVLPSFEPHGYGIPAVGNLYGGWGYYGYGF